MDRLKPKLDTVKVLLDQAYKILSPENGDQEPEYMHLIPSKPTVSSAITNIQANGFIRIQRQTLYDIELAIIDPSSSQKIYKTSFREDKRWNLQQIHDVQMHLKNILISMELLVQIYEKSSKIDKAYLKLQVQDPLRRALSRIRIPAKLSLRSLCRSKFKTLFNPVLPSNYLINSFICDGAFIVDLYVVGVSVNESSSNIPNVFNLKQYSLPKPAEQDPDLYNFSVESNYPKSNSKQCYTYERNSEFLNPLDKNQKYSVQNSVRLKTDLSWLQVVLAHLQQASEEVNLIINLE